MSKIKNGNDRLSRRKFLKTAGMGTGVVAAGLLVKPVSRVRAASTRNLR